MNALKHGLRAREFGLLPEENQAEWAEHVRDLRAGYGPVDATEEKLVTAIAGTMWKEIRADRAEADAMIAIAPSGPGRSHGTDMSNPEHRLSLVTALRYASAAGMATRRAQRAFLAHRKAGRAGLILPAVEREIRTYDFLHRPPRSSLGPASDTGPAHPKRTNDFLFGDSQTVRHARIGGTRTGSPTPRPPGAMAPPAPSGPLRRFGHALMHTSAMLQVAGTRANTQ